MTKCFRYLFMFNYINYLYALGFSLFLLAGCYVTGVPDDGRGLFAGYFGMYPTMLMMAALFSGTAFCSSSLNHALSYGARREDYYWGMWGIILVNIAVYSLMAWGFSRLPELLGWSAEFLLTRQTFTPIFPFVLLIWHSVGCALGRLYITHRKLAGVVTGLSIFFLLMNPIYNTIASHTGSFWGDLPWLLLSAGALVIFICQFYAYSVIKLATVR